MRLSIRARLTLWYCSIVVLVLVTGGVVGAFVQFELAMVRLDEDLARSMATLQGVMRTEFGEGLSLEDSAQEASIEVVVPDRESYQAFLVEKLLDLPIIKEVRSNIAIQPLKTAAPLPLAHLA